MKLAVEMRKPRVGNRVAIPGHALVFFIKSVNEADKTVDAEIISDTSRIEKNIPWKMLTFIDFPEPPEEHCLKSADSSINLKRRTQE
jgi:hypothetical protein